MRQGKISFRELISRLEGVHIHTYEHKLCKAKL